jgi:polygalacturonase
MYISKNIVSQNRKVFFLLSVFLCLPFSLCAQRCNLNLEASYDQKIRESLKHATSHTMNTNDDCIRIKAARDQDDWNYGPLENIIVRNNTFYREVRSGFCIGIEMSGGSQNLFVHHNTLIRGKKHAFQFKSNLDRGGIIKEICIKTPKVLDTVKYGLKFTTNYKGCPGNEYFVGDRGFYFHNIDIDSAEKLSITITGKEEKPIKRIFMENLSISKSSVPFIANFTQDLILGIVSIDRKQITKVEVSQPSLTKKNNYHV